jgi:hypothetical protein
MADEKKTERKNLTITHVEEIKKVGDKQIPKLPFKAKDGDSELSYFTFRSSLFDAIKVGQTINVDVETSTRVWDGQTYTDRRVVQVYVDGQPIGGKGQQGYRGRSPEELEQTARTMSLSYAKDLAVADKIPVAEITKQADVFYAWVKKTEKPPEPKVEKETEEKPPETKTTTVKDSGTITRVQNVAELKGLMAKHKIGTREAYEILSINSFMELIDLDEAWAKIKEAKQID